MKGQGVRADNDELNAMGSQALDELAEVWRQFH